MSARPEQHDESDGFATLMCVLCWVGYLGLGLAYVLRQPVFAGAALVVIVVAYGLAQWQERRR